MFQPIYYLYAYLTVGSITNSLFPYEINTGHRMIQIPNGYKKLISKKYNTCKPFGP